MRVEIVPYQSDPKALVAQWEATSSGMLGRNQTFGGSEKRQVLVREGDAEISEDALVEVVVIGGLSLMYLPHSAHFSDGDDVEQVIAYIGNVALSATPQEWEMLSRRIPAIVAKGRENLALLKQLNAPEAVGS